MTTEKQIVEWFVEFRKENPKFENEYVSSGQLIYWLAQKKVLKISSNNVLADSLPTQCVKEWENSEYCDELGKCQKCL